MAQKAESRGKMEWNGLKSFFRKSCWSGISLYLRIYSLNWIYTYCFMGIPATQLKLTDDSW